MRSSKFVFIVSTLILLAGCSANHHSIYRSRNLDSQSLTTVDAKQRAIITGPQIVKGGESHIPFCAEPSPDVFSVMAQALSAGGTFGKGADPATVQAALSAAFSSSEQASTIPRTQTINMLRELMYRTCERYVSGAINELELPIQAVRDQRLMVSILAIEQLTSYGAAMATAIGATAEAAAGSAGADLILRLDDQRRLIASNAETLASKEEALKKETDCAAIKDAIDKKKEDTLTTDQKSKKEKCAQLQADVESARKTKEANEKYYGKLEQAIGATGIPVSASAKTVPPIPGERELKSDGDVIKDDIAKAVSKIVKESFKQDEFLFLCLKAMKDDGAFKNLQDNCLIYLSAKIQFETPFIDEEKVAKLRLLDENLANSQFNDFWPLVASSSGTQVDTSKLNGLRSSVEARAWPKCLNNAATKPQVEDCFKREASKGVRNDLIRGAKK